MARCLTRPLRTVDTNDANLFLHLVHVLSPNTETTGRGCSHSVPFLPPALRRKLERPAAHIGRVRRSSVE